MGVDTVSILQLSSNKLGMTNTVNLPHIVYSSLYRFKRFYVLSYHTPQGLTYNKYRVDNPEEPSFILYVVLDWILFFQSGLS